MASVDAVLGSLALTLECPGRPSRRATVVLTKLSGKSEGHGSRVGSVVIAQRYTSLSLHCLQIASRATARLGDAAPMRVMAIWSQIWIKAGTIPMSRLLSIGTWRAIPRAQVPAGKRFFFRIDWLPFTITKRRHGP